MNPREAFNQTIEKFSIRPVDIALKTGFSEAYISRYRSGVGGKINSENLVKMLRAFPCHAQYYFWSLCMGNDDQMNISA